MAGKPTLITQLGLPPALMTDNVAEMRKTINAMIRALRIFNGETGEVNLIVPSALTENIRSVNRSGVAGVEINAPGSGVEQYVVKLGAADVFVLPETPQQDAPNGSLALETGTGGVYARQSGAWVALGAGSGGGSGTVTSVNVSGGTTGLNASGGPVTASGTITLAGTLIAPNGGTGFATYTVGDILYASSTTALSKLADVTTGNALISGGVGVAPSWGKIGLTTHVSGTLPIANGGTNGTATPTAGAISYGTGTAFAFTAAGTSGQVLTSGGGGIPTWTTPTTGTVTSVGQTFTGGLVSVAGSPVTGSGTLALTVAGTSGGVPYFSSASTWASSAALAANALVIGGGAGVAPATTTTGAGVVTALGTNVGTAGAFVTNGGALGTPSSGVATNLTGTAASLTAGTATNATNTAVTDDTSTSAYVYPTWVSATTGNLPQKTTSNSLFFLPVSGALFANSFQGDGSALSNVTAVESVNAVNTTISNNNSLASTVYPTWVTGAGGNLPQNVSSTRLSFVPSTGVLSVTGVSLTNALGIGSGGTGQTTANAALNALLPSQATNSGKYLTTNGTNTSWATVSGSGTVTSVAQSFTGGLISVAGSPITAAGTLALTVAGTSGGIPYFSSAAGWASSAELAASALVVGGGAGAAPSTIATGTGVTTALGVNTGTAGAFVVNGGALGTPSSGTVTNLTGTASININGTVGATTPTTGAFTTLSANSTVSGTGFSAYLASPPAIGGTLAAAGTFTTVTGKLTPTAGTATAGTAPIKLTAGTNLTTAEAGAIEYDGSSFFATGGTTTGRGAFPTEQIYRQVANGTTTLSATIADFFPANSSISLAAATLYEIQCWCYFLKTTGGSVTFSMLASSAPAWMNGHYRAGGATGASVASGGTTGWAGSAAVATAAWSATASLNSGVNHGFLFTIRILTNLATNWRMRYTSNAGTTQSLIGSYYTVRALPAASTGTFVA